MAVAMLMEVPGDPHPTAYDQVNETMDIDNDPPAGLIVHTAGRSEKGTWRIFDIWESREDFDRFNETRLGPALREVMGDQMAETGPPVQEFYELYNVWRP